LSESIVIERLLLADREYGGTAWVESEIGTGSTFTFTIPIGCRAKAETEAEATEEDMLGSEVEPEVEVAAEAEMPEKMHEVPAVLQQNRDGAGLNSSEYAVDVSGMSVKFLLVGEAGVDDITLRVRKSTIEARLDVI
jgi:hypothetical protein